MTQYLDLALAKGYTYRYRAFAVDAALNHSAPVDASSVLDLPKLGRYLFNGFANTVVTNGSYAYVTVGSDTWDSPGQSVPDRGLSILDISDPTSPLLVGRVATAGWSLDVKIKKGVAYIADGPNGLTVVNVSNPASPTVIGHANAGKGSSVALQGNYAYVTGGKAPSLWYSNPLSLDDGGLYIFDVTTPSAPTVVGQYANATQGKRVCNVTVSGGRAYLGNFSNVSLDLEVLDVTNAASPTSIAQFDMNIANSVHPRSTLSGAYAYLVNQTGFNVVDVSNSASPVKVASYQTAEKVNDVVFFQSYAILARGKALEVVDVSNPLAPTLVFQAPAINAQRVFLSGATLYVASGSGGLELYDASALIRQLQLSGQSASFHRHNSPPNILAIEPPYVYVSDNDWGFDPIDFSVPSSPVQGTAYSKFYWTIRQIVMVTPSLAYAVLTHNLNTLPTEIVLLDLTNPLAPTEIGSFSSQHVDGAGRPLALGTLSVNGARLYAAQLRYVEIFDISNPLAPSSIGFYTGGSTQNLQKVVVRGNYGFVADYGQGFVGSYDTNSKTLSPSTTPGGLVVLNVLDPAHVTQVAKTDLWEARDVTLVDNVAYVATTGANSLAWQQMGIPGGVVAIDVTTPNAPTLKSFYNHGIYPLALAAEGGVVYATDQSGSILAGGGLLAFDASRPDDVQYMSGYGGLAVFDVRVSAGKAYIYGADPATSATRAIVLDNAY